MSVRELASAPGSLSLFPRAVAGATVLPVIRRLPGVPAPAGLPDTELALTGLQVDRERLAAYARVCGLRLRDELPPTYAHMLAFPLAMRLMTDSAFPFSPVGLVHVRNRIVQRRPLRAGEELGVRVRAADLRPHPRGTQFDVLAEVAAGGEAVWSGTSTYLRREGGTSSPGRDADRPEPPRPAAIWDVPGDTGRRYAAVSGDANPIHLHPLTARLLGMPRHIAHGMWAKARCLAALEGTLPGGAVEIDVRFKLPIQLPARVAFASAPEGDGRAFSLHDARTGKPHLDGTALPG